MKGCPLAASLDSFPHDWSAEILLAPPLIAPVRRFTYPQQIAGEEDSLERGALQTLVRPAQGGPFLATFALGFTDPTMPTGIFSCPNPRQLCAVAGGYAYVIDTTIPDPGSPPPGSSSTACLSSETTTNSTLLPLKPVTAIHALPQLSLLLFTGFHSIVAWGQGGIAWQSQRLSWEGVRLVQLDAGTLHGTGWNLLTDREVPFTLNLLTGEHVGGGFTPPDPASALQRS